MFIILLARILQWIGRYIAGTPLQTKTAANAQ
jgi:hypothetical protein